jgi:hypothetical protein
MNRFAPVLAVFVMLAAAVPVLAQPAPPAPLDYTEADIIAMAVAGLDDGGVLAASLEDLEGWWGQAYPSRNGYDIWRVELFTADDEELGWLDVQPETGIVYSYFVIPPLPEWLYAEREPEVKAFVARNERVRALIARPREDEMWVEYNRWEQHWGVYIEADAHSLYVTVDYAPGDSEPVLDMIYFAEMLSFAEWRDAMEAEASVIAFSDPQVAAAVRGVQGWQAGAERLDGGDVWDVVYRVGETVLVTARVDVLSDRVIAVTLGG